MEFPNPNWREDDPAGLGCNVDDLESALKAIETFGSIAAMVIYKGAVVASTGRPSEKVLVRSVRKSFLSALIGIAVHERQIDLDMTMAGLGIDDVDPALTDQERQATVRDLLKARSGVYHAALAESAEMVASKPARGSARPGTSWNYNNWDFNVLGTIYERATKQSIYEGFLERIAKPTGMENYRPEDGSYLTGTQSSHPAYHFRMTIGDMARFGHLYLNEGRWNDAQVVPAEWVLESTRSYSRTPKGGGYGYMWWTNGADWSTGREGHASPSLPRLRFSAEGAYGQLIRVVPDKRLVLVLLSKSMQRSKEVWDDYRTFTKLAAAACPCI